MPLSFADAVLAALVPIRMPPLTVMDPECAAMAVADALFGTPLVSVKTRQCTFQQETRKLTSKSFNRNEFQRIVAQVLMRCEFKQKEVFTK